MCEQGKAAETDVCRRVYTTHKQKFTPHTGYKYLYTVLPCWLCTAPRLLVIMSSFCKIQSLFVTNIAALTNQQAALEITGQPSQYSDCATGSGRGERYFLQMFKSFISSNDDILQRFLHLSQAGAVDPSPFLSVSLYFNTSVPLLPKPFGVFL